MLVKRFFDMHLVKYVQILIDKVLAFDFLLSDHLKFTLLTFDFSLISSIVHLDHKPFAKFHS